MEFRAVVPGVWLAVCGTERANVTLIAGEERALLVDAGGSPDEGRALRAAAGRVLDVPLSYCVISHAHWDHAFGLAGLGDLETMAHTSFAEVLACPENQAAAAQQGFDPAALPPPGRLIDLIGALDLGGVTAEIVHLGAAHTAGDLIVAVPERNLIVVGDLVEVDGPPQLDPTGSLDGWVDVLDGLQAMMHPGLLVIPGHGDPTDQSSLAQTRRALTDSPRHGPVTARAKGVRPQWLGGATSPTIG